MSRSRASRWAVAVASAVIASLTVVVGPAVAQSTMQPTSTTAPSVQTYVALGDSYTAGPLIPLQTGLPPGCARSNRNYPSLVAATLGVTGFRDVSCSGATTGDLTAAQPVPLGVNPPQLDALSATTELVTLGIGGNDIGFFPVIQECTARSPLAPFGAACKAFFTSGGTDQLAARIAATAPKIAAALQGIRERSPAARVLLVGYPAILPDGPGCFPVIPFSPGDTAYLRDTEKRLNAMLADQAGQAGVDYVDTYTPTLGHDICQPPGRKWIEGLVPTSPAAPVHPNALGMVAVSQAVLGAVADQAAPATAA